MSAPELGLLLSSFFAAFAFGQLAVGPLSDRFGRRSLVLGGLAVFAAGSIVCAFADTLSFLVLGRVIQALGACAASVLSRAVARDLFDGQALARALVSISICGAGKDSARKVVAASVVRKPVSQTARHHQRRQEMRTAFAQSAHMEPTCMEWAWSPLRTSR